MVKVKRIIYQILIVLLALLAGAVFVTSLVTTIYYDMHVDVDFPHYKAETVWHLLVSMAVVFIIFLFLYRKRFFEKNKALITAALLFCAGYCLLLIFSIKPLPVNDSKIIDDILYALENGDYSSISEPGGYLFIWPFQLGYVFFGQMIDGLFGHGNYMAWDLIQMASILITVYLLYRIAWELFYDKVICGIVSLLSFGMLFFYNYVTYIYGDIMSMAPQTLALYFTILFLKRKKMIYGLLTAVFIGTAVVLKTNCEIALIATSMVTVLSIFDKKVDKKYRFSALCVVAITFIVVFAMKAGVDNYYCRLTGLSKIPSGSPSASHIAMGLQESDLEDGWYNGYNYQVFAANGYDTEKTKAAAIENIKERLSFFMQHPGVAAKFFARKFLTQWADPVCISTHNLDLVSRHVENPTKLMEYIVFGDGSVIIRWVMNVFMSVCYLCVVVYLISRIGSGELKEQEMLLLILIFGGMLFHEFWEGSSRYAMRYYVYWLPYAAFGMKRILSFREKKV